MEDHDTFTICRICLREDGAMTPIQDSVDDSGAQISGMFFLCCGVECLPHVDLPSKICQPCLTDLGIAYKLRKTSEQSEEILRSNLQIKVTFKNELEQELLSCRDLIVEDGQMGSTESLCHLTEEVHVENPSEMPVVGGGRDEIIVEEPCQKRVTRTARKAATSTTKKAASPLFCDLCKRHFSRQDIFVTHIRRHNNEKNFICTYCGKGFVNNFEMNRHARRHTGDKPYPCLYCDKAFSDFSSRNKHHNMHTQKRPYPCKICGKSFNYPHVLRAHKTVHTGERKHKCTICLKTFTQPHHLKKHLETHTKREVINE